MASHLSHRVVLQELLAELLPERSLDQLSGALQGLSAGVSWWDRCSCSSVQQCHDRESSSKVKYGPVRSSPNPFQRNMSGHPVMTAIVFAQILTLAASLLLLLSGLSWRVPVMFHLCAIPLGIGMWFFSPGRKMTRKEFDDSIVPYLPWPAWWPGYRKPPDGSAR